MNELSADDFATTLRRLTPTGAQLESLGVSPGVRTKIVDSYNCVPRPARVCDDPAGPLVDLVCTYDVSRIVIGMVEFSEPKRSEERLEFGNVELDRLFLDCGDGEVKLGSFPRPTEVVCRCARTQEAFLKAMLSVAEFATSALLHPSIADDDDARRHTMDECVRLAGGEEFRTFYDMLLG